MFDITAIFSAIAKFFEFMLKLWERSDEDKKKKLYAELEAIKKQIKAETDEVKLNALLEKKADIVRRIKALDIKLKQKGLKNEKPNCCSSNSPVAGGVCCGTSNSSLPKNRQNRNNHTKNAGE